MLSALRLRSVGWKLRMLRPRPFHHMLRFTSSSAGDRQADTMQTKAVIFDMGGVLTQSPVPFLAGTQSTCGSFYPVVCFHHKLC